MRTMLLYTGNGFSFSPRYEDGMQETGYVRLVADQGSAITNGMRIVYVADIHIDDIGSWTDCDRPDDEDVQDAGSDELLSIILGGVT